MCYLSGYLKIPPYTLYNILPPEQKHRGVRIYVKLHSTMTCTAKVGKLKVVCGAFRFANIRGSLKLVGLIFGVPVIMEPRERLSEKAPHLSIKYAKTGDEIGVLWINKKCTTIPVRIVDKWLRSTYQGKLITKNKLKNLQRA